MDLGRVEVVRSTVRQRGPLSPEVRECPSVELGQPFRKNRSVESERTTSVTSKRDLCKNRPTEKSRNPTKSLGSRTRGDST